MSIFEIASKIGEYVTNIVQLFNKFVDLIKTGIDVIPEPFKTILLIFLPIAIVIWIYIIFKR